ncbi:hypothetical protein CHARACLAT_009144 [Characodon lateralis]|uniref:Uncharacterized protein n=1 Tax=Characodon lateralis TaxID=208331 RepID=A0ABU7DFG1_9TELE|nr:hypothetical protein [Characodon lateralis]
MTLSYIIGDFWRLFVLLYTPSSVFWHSQVAESLHINPSAATETPPCSNPYINHSIKMLADAHPGQDRKANCLKYTTAFQLSHFGSSRLLMQIVHSKNVHIVL